MEASYYLIPFQHSRPMQLTFGDPTTLDFYEPAMTYWNQGS
ncbi:hypothetical protein ACIP5Y_24960 [Nocardia sp. NPDC088792]